MLPVVLAVGLAIYAILDCARTPSDRLPGRVPKPLWILVILLVAFVGPIAWIVASRVSQAEERGGALSTSVWSSPEGLELFRRKRSADEPVAPDDDPDFLFSLEAQLYRERKERERRLRRNDEAGSESQVTDPPAEDSETDDEGGTFDSRG